MDDPNESTVTVVSGNGTTEACQNGGGGSGGRGVSGGRCASQDVDSIDYDLAPNTTTTTTAQRHSCHGGGQSRVSGGGGHQHNIDEAVLQHLLSMKTLSSRSSPSSLDSGDLLAASTPGNERTGSVSSRAASVICACAGGRGSRRSGRTGPRRIGRHRRWPEVALLGRAMFVVSVAFFVVGILVTVFGFGGTNGVHNTGSGSAVGHGGVPVSYGPEIAGGGTGSSMLSVETTAPEVRSRHVLPMQIVGPALLVATLVVWLAGLVFWRLWSTEWERRKRAMELRTRVQLHALAMDLMKHPTTMLFSATGSSPTGGGRGDGLDASGVTAAGNHVTSQGRRRSNRSNSVVVDRLNGTRLSVADLQDPRLRRLLLRKLRQQNALDLASSADNSRRSSRAGSLESRRRRSSAVSALLRQAAAAAGTGNGSSATVTSHHHHHQHLLDHRLSVDVTSGKSSRSSHRTSRDGRRPYTTLPGIEISRIDTMDFDDGSSVFSSATGGLRLGSLVTGRGGRQRFIVIHSDGSSDVSRLSFPSEYSLSATSRSRSSRASSNVSSRLWDFASPRESDWDLINTAAGGAGSGTPGARTTSRGQSSSTASMSRPDLSAGRDYSLLTPAMPRKGSSVTFDIGEPTVRRHSSPAPSLRFRKDSVVEAVADCGRDSCPVCAAAIGKKAASVTVSPGRGNGGNGSGIGSGTVGVHQPLEKRSSSRVSRCSNGGGSSNVESLLSVVMTTTSVPEDASVVEQTSKVHNGRSSLARPASTATSSTTAGDPLTKTATTAVEVLYGPSTVGTGVTVPGGRSSPRRCNTNTNGSSHMIIDFVTSSSLNDRPSSAPVTRPPGRTEAGTQTARRARTDDDETPPSGGHSIETTINILSSPPAPPCNKIGKGVGSTAEKSLSDNESRIENDDDDDDDLDFSDGGSERVTDELLAANLDRRSMSVATTGNSGADRRAKSTTTVKKVGSGACKLLSSLMSAPLSGVRTVGGRAATSK